MNHMNGKSKISAILGVVVLVATIVIFAISRPVMFPATILGFCFLVYSEIVFFGDFILLEYLAKKSSEILTRVGVGIPIAIYAAVVFISSLIYMNIHILAFRGFLILQILLFVAVVIVAYIIGAFSSSARYKDAKVLQADLMVRGFAEELLLIKEQTEKKAEIDKLIESIRFSDTSVMVDADVELNDTISNLGNVVKAEEFDESEFDKAVKDIEFMIKKRNLQTKNAKQGGI